MHKAIAHFAFEFLGKDALSFPKLLQFQLIKSSNYRSKTVQASKNTVFVDNKLHSGLE